MTPRPKLKTKNKNKIKINLGLDLEFNSVYFGIEINKQLKFSFLKVSDFFETY